MKWQDFYFEWLEKIGYYDWFNATLVGYKTSYPVGGRSNIGTVGFGGDGEPPIQDVPYIPTYTHPAQSLIESQLADTGNFGRTFDNGITGYSRNFIGMFNSNTNPILLGEENFGEPQKNTLRYWGYQPGGQTFSAPTNFYRGYAYHSNAMKQKKELRGRRGDVLIRDSKKSWFTDKKNRTYPSLRKNQMVPMVAIRHTDYSHYGDVGNLMEIAWGSMNGLSYNYNEAGAPELNSISDYQANLESKVTEINPRSYQDNYQPATSLARGVGIVAQTETTVNLETYLTQIGSMRLATEEELGKMQEITNFVSQKYADNKGVIIRNKKFREIDYVADKIRYDTRQQINNLLLSVDNQMSVTTAEIILQILANPMLGVNLQGDISRGPIQTIIDEFMDNLIPRDTQIKLQELLMMHGHQVIPTTGISNFASKTWETPIGSFYLGIPMNKLQFTYPFQVSGSNDVFRWSWNSDIVSVSVRNGENGMDATTRGSIGYEQLFTNQQTDGVALEIMNLWQDLEIVDDSLMPLVDAIVNYLPTIQSSNYGLEKFGNLSWIFALPTWVNPNYALAVTNSEIAKANSTDWQPRDIGFIINGQEQYMYEIKLSDWAEEFLNQEPQISNQKYWDISMLFNQPITKKMRGSTEREILGVHQIALDLQPRAGNNTYVVKNKIVSNNLGMVECNANESQWSGAFNSGELIGITYEFFSNVVEWPYNLQYPGWENKNTPNEAGLGAMQSYLTPMDDDTDWWNQFLDNETGILSMGIQEEGGIVRYKGWFIGWDFGYMDSIIQKAKSRGHPWAENLTLESFCQKVYPSETVEVHFRPKQPYYVESETQLGSYGGGFSVLNTNDGFQQIFNHKTTGNNLVFLPFETRNVNAKQDATRVRFNHLNNMGGAENIIASDDYKRNLAIVSNPSLGFSSMEDWENYIDNDEGYLPTIQPSQFRPSNTISTYNSSSFRNGRLNGIIEAGGIEPIPRKTKDAMNQQYTIMFQENGSMVAIPNYAPVVKSWTPDEWATLNESTGYNNINAVVTGNTLSLSQETRGESYAPNFRGVAKCIINEDMPSDILEVEEMPQSFVGRNIDYSMPSGSPWKRGKIFMINWVAILTPSILRMLTPPTE